MNKSIDYQVFGYVEKANKKPVAIQFPSFHLHEMSVKEAFEVDKYPHLSTGLRKRSQIKAGDFGQPAENQTFQFSTGCFLMG
jgi:hypothetical protein